MEALRLYTEAFQMILNVHTGKSANWKEIYDVFEKLHSLLVCAVCRKLCVDPYLRQSENCSHNICKSCMYAQLPAHCDGCYVNREFEQNMRLRLLLQSYKNMCKFIWASNKIKKSDDLFAMPVFEWNKRISDGALYEDIFHYSRTKNQDSQSKNSDVTNPDQQETNLKSKTPLNQPKINSKDCPKVGLKNIPNTTGSYKVVKKCLASHNRSTCNCGISASSSTVPTCSDRTCSCFAANLTCRNCQCQGCKNPIKYGPARVRNTEPVPNKNISKTEEQPISITLD